MLLGTRVSLTRYRYFLRAYFGTFRGCTPDASIRLPVLRVVARSVRDRCEIGARSVRDWGVNGAGASTFRVQLQGRCRAESVRDRCEIGVLGKDQQAPVYSAVLGVLGHARVMLDHGPRSAHS